MSETQDIQFKSIDDLFDASLEDIADLPSFEVPTPGQYVLGVTVEVKQINNKDAVIAHYNVKECSEKKDPNAPDAKPGQKFDVAYILGNNVSTGRLKQFLAPFAAAFGTSKVGELIREKLSEELLIAATVKNRKDKDDPEKLYADVVNIIIA